MTQSEGRSENSHYAAFFRDGPGTMMDALGWCQRSLVPPTRPVLASGKSLPVHEISELAPGPVFCELILLRLLCAHLCPQTPCQQELDQVLERISTMRLPDERGPLEHLYSLHIPNCDKHGLYNLKQVREEGSPRRGAPGVPCSCFTYLRAKPRRARLL